MLQNMTIIINIQNMSNIINPNNTYSFKELEHKSYDELQKIQNELIPYYNKIILK